MKIKQAGANVKSCAGEEKTSISNIIELMIEMQVQANLTLKGLELLKREWEEKIDVKP